MSRYFELWDTDSGNLMATFDTEAEAITVVRETIRQDGSEAVADWVLGWGDEEGNGEAIAHGRHLAALALSAATTPPPSRTG